MTEEIFAFDDNNYESCQNLFRGKNNKEYYLGEYSIERGAHVDVKAHKKSVGACSLIKLTSKSTLFFRRSWSHIQEDPTDVTSLCFVKRGRLTISHQKGSTTIKSGEFFIAKSMAPFTMECTTHDQSQFEIFHIVVPSHILRKFIAMEINVGFRMSLANKNLYIAEKMFAGVFNEQGELNNTTEQLLVDCALSILCEGLKQCEESLRQRQSMPEKRKQDVLQYIEIHLSDPKLSAEMVAQACGISRRYLSHLMKQHGTTFPNLIWDWRLKTAHEWLSSDVANDISIAEIAFRIGFKSPAHFSRLFKKVYKMSPREFRSKQETPTITVNSRENINLSQIPVSMV